MAIILNVKRFDKSISLPDYEKKKFRPACFDLIIREEIVIQPRTIGLVKLNIAVKIPEDYALMLYIRSSTPMRRGLIAANSVGIIDAFYCGDNDELIYPMYNITDHEVKILKGEALVQAMLIKSEEVKFNEVEKMNEEGNGGYTMEP